MAESNWKDQLRGAVKGEGGHFPLLSTPYYYNLGNKEDPEDPVLRQIIPSDKESEIKPYELNDPLDENRFRVHPRLIHRYKDRVLLHVTGLCPVNCRHCFRRGFLRQEQFVITAKETKEICFYLKNHREVKEIILSGGDPLILDDSKLFPLLEQLRDAQKDIILRIGSRVPVVLPERITSPLVEKLAELFPLWIATHFNHPREITAQSSRALTCLVRAGIPIVNQTVLLKGINNRVHTLAELFRGLLRLGVKPYYLLQGDLAPGTAHFRTPLKESITLYRKLALNLSGMALPKLALDLPGGGGKVCLTDGSIIREEEGFYILKGYDDKEYKYPIEQ